MVINLLLSKTHFFNIQSIHNHFSNSTCFKKNPSYGSDFFLWQDFNQI